MYENNEHILLSLASAGTASALLLWQGYLVSGFLFFTTFLYFLSKLRGYEKVYAPENFKVVVVGAGVSGICIGKRLNDVGIKYTILEKSADLGGTWFDNIYPGVACDVPSHLYSYSFFQNPNWSRAFSKGPEIFAYLQAAASRFGVYPNIRFQRRVVRTTWDQTKCLWTIETACGETYTANVVVTGTGGLHVPRLPNYKGMDDFKGEAFHTALWRKEFDPTNKTIAIIGTGASAVQTVPNLAAMGVSELKVFQRSPCWSPPRLDYQYPEFIKTLFRLIPLTNTLHRYFIFLRNETRFQMIFTNTSWINRKISDWVHDQVRDGYRKTVKDPKLAEKLMPDYDMGCKRITPSDTYLKAFNRDNVHLLTDKISEITEAGVRTVDGVEHRVDTIIYATGFDMLQTANPFQVIGLKGLDVFAEDGDVPLAYLGITKALSPNMFHLVGPGTGLGHNTIIYMIECEADYTVDAITKMLNRGARAMVVKEAVVKNYWDWVQDTMKGKVFADNSGCTGWYRNDRGINWTLWPSDLFTYWWRTKSCNMDDYYITY